MKVIKVKDLFSVTQITASGMSDHIWIKLQELANECDEDIEFDFEEIELERPWNNTEFKKLMSNERVYLRVYLAETIKKTIDMMCNFANWKSGRVINDEPVSDIILPTKTKNNDIDRIYNIIKPHFHIENGIADIVLYDCIDQIGSRDSIEALQRVIMDIHNDTGVSTFKVDTELMFIQTNLLDDIANLIVELDNIGINMEFHSDEENIQEYISTAINIHNAGKLDTRGKLKIIKEMIPKNTVGMLKKYKDTRKKDNFGRVGNGQVILCRPAIFRGILKKDKTIYLVFDEYNGQNFVTKLDYVLDNDGMGHPGLIYNRKKISLEDIGIENKFTGMRYHFELPIQEYIEDCVTTYTVDGDDIIENEILFPEFLKNVFDSFDVKYNKEKLEESIEETKRILGR